MPALGDYGVAMCFMPQDEASRDLITQTFEKFIKKEGQSLIGWRDVPTTLDGLGKAVIDSMPVIRQCFVARGLNCADQDAFERKLLVIRKQTQNLLAQMAEKHGLPGIAQLYMPSFSTRTIVYKGLLLATQGLVLRRFARSRLRLGARPGAPAFQHQHLPQLEARAPVSLHGAQR